MATLAHEGAMFLTGIKKFKNAKTRFLDILECVACVRGKNSLRDLRGELFSINANIGTRGCDVFDRNQKVQKMAKHGFFTESSVIGAFVEKTNIVTQVAN